MYFFQKRCHVSLSKRLHMTFCVRDFRHEKDVSLNQQGRRNYCGESLNVYLNACLFAGGNRFHRYEELSVCMTKKDLRYKTLRTIMGRVSPCTDAVIIDLQGDRTIKKI